MIFALTSSMMKAFGFQFGFDSYIFWLITSIHLVVLLTSKCVMHTIEQLFFHLSNTINVYNGNWYEHKQLLAFVNILQSCFIIFWRFFRLSNVSFNVTNYFIFICSKGNINGNRTLMTILLHYHYLSRSLNSNCERDISTW